MSQDRSRLLRNPRDSCEAVELFFICVDQHRVSLHNFTNEKARVTLFRTRNRGFGGAAVPAVFEVGKRRSHLRHCVTPRKMKRGHSPSPTTHTKVQHSSETSDTSSGRRKELSFDEAFYDELMLVIFSYLSARDLCAIQPTNRKWARLSQDNQVHLKRDAHEVRKGLTRGGSLRLR